MSENHFPSAMVAAAVSLAAVATASAQLTPVRTYCGIDRPIPVDVASPASDAVLRIDLLRAVGDEVVASAETEAGQADLAALFPALWTRAAVDADLLYAQLLVDDLRHGPPLVLQPLLTPTYPASATSDDAGRIRPRAVVDRSGKPRFLEPEPEDIVYSGLRLWQDRRVVLLTSAGEIELLMRPDQAPNTVWHFIQLVEGGAYHDVPFHRIVPDNHGHPFVIQTGDPSGTGFGGAGAYIDLEPSALPHGYGTVSMARAADPNSNGSQFFICLSRDGTRHLDGAYTAFAQVTTGSDAIAAIAATPVNESGGPRGEPPRLLEARTEPAPPIGAGLGPLTAPEATER